MPIGFTCGRNTLDPNRRGYGLRRRRLGTNGWEDTVLHLIYIIIYTHTHTHKRMITGIYATTGQGGRSNRYRWVCRGLDRTARVCARARTNNGNGMQAVAVPDLYTRRRCCCCCCCRCCRSIRRVQISYAYTFIHAQDPGELARHLDDDGVNNNYNNILVSFIVYRVMLQSWTSVSNAILSIRSRCFPNNVLQLPTVLD